MWLNFGAVVVLGIVVWFWGALVGFDAGKDVGRNACYEEFVNGLERSRE